MLQYLVQETLVIKLLYFVNLYLMTHDHSNASAPLRPFGFGFGFGFGFALSSCCLRKGLPSHDLLRHLLLDHTRRFLSIRLLPVSDSTLTRQQQHPGCLGLVVSLWSSEKARPRTSWRRQHEQLSSARIKRLTFYDLVRSGNIGSCLHLKRMRRSISHHWQSLKLFALLRQELERWGSKWQNVTKANKKTYLPACYSHPPYPPKWPAQKYNFL